MSVDSISERDDAGAPALEGNLSDAARAPDEGAQSSPRDLDAGPQGSRAQEPEGGGEFIEDGRADVALDFVIDALAMMGMDCTVDLLENEEDDPPEEIRLEIEGKDAGRIIGKKGQTLAALQFLANRVINRPGKKRRHVIIDAEGYRARREDTLSSMAVRLGKQAVDEGKIITFEPMNPADRRVVHLALAKFPGVVTKSDGEGESRRVQIIPVRR